MAVSYDIDNGRRQVAACCGEAAGAIGAPALPPRSVLPGAGIEAGAAPVPGGYGCTISSCYLRPRSRGSVTLRDAEVRTPPRIDPAYWTDERDPECSLRGLEPTREIAAQPALRRYADRGHLPGPDRRDRSRLAGYAARYGKTDYHPAGTCRMGAGDDAVVDRQCRGYGIDRLRIADSAVMPRIIASSTNAAAVMVAEKASDRILQRSRSGPP